MMGAGGSNSRKSSCDRGTTSGIMRGWLVVTTDGIVGIVRPPIDGAKVYWLTEFPDFAAGVISRSPGPGHSQGRSPTICKVDMCHCRKVEVERRLVFTAETIACFERLPVGDREIGSRLKNRSKRSLASRSGSNGGLEDVLM